MKVVKKLSVIAYHYVVKGNFLTDISATIPGYMIMSYPDYPPYQKLYWFRLIRFIQIRTVYGAVQNSVKFIFTKGALNKANIEKSISILNLIIGLSTSVHILACAWIYIGKIT